MRWLRAPLLHFVAGGFALFCVTHRWPAATPAAAPVVLTAADVERLRADYTRDTGFEPTAADEAALVEKAIEEELLVREAVARGLDRHDRSVRNWLVEQMRVLSEDAGADPERLYEQARGLGLDRSDVVVRRILVQKMRLLAARLDERPPDADTLAAYYAAHRDEYRPADAVSFWHVFVSSDARGPAMEPDATALLASLRGTGRPPVAPMAGGDAFPAPAHVVGRTAAQVATVFGPAFADALAHVEIGAWVGPIASAYGVHLVWVERREAGAPPALDAVRGRVVERWQAEQRAVRVGGLLRELADRYPMQIESRAWRERGRS
jgi:hypothetical protein